MNELFLYDYIKTILNASTTFEGRFIVAEGYGNALNANNFNEVFTDLLTSYVDEKDYPMSILMPPTEVVGDYNLGWSRFKLDQFFVKQSGETIDNNNNSTDRKVIEDWNDMRVAAGEYRRIFKDTLKAQNLLMMIRPVSNDDFIKRVSNSNNDRVSGVVVTYYVDVYMGACTFGDYTLEIAPWPTPGNCCMPEGGTEGQVLKIVNGEPTWVDDTGGSGGGIQRMFLSAVNNDPFVGVIMDLNEAGSTTDTIITTSGIGSIQIILPPALSNPYMYTIKRTGPGPGATVITFQPSDTGDGSSSISLLVPYQSIDLISNQSNNYNVI